jgi:ATP-dependent RNA helicase DDX42
MQASPAIGGKGLAVRSIHGDKDQRDRNAALSALKKGKLAALVATDVASRGLDVPDIQTVVNFDAAKNLDSHVHRIGRAGRLQVGSDAGQQKGIAYTLLTPKNADFANTLVDAFYREGREVTDELLTLARKSKQHGGQRSKWNKTGLGFGDNDAKGSSSAHKNAAIGSGHYGPCSAGSNRDDH